MLPNVSSLTLLLYAFSLCLAASAAPQASTVQQGSTVPQGQSVVQSSTVPQVSTGAGMSTAPQTAVTSQSPATTQTASAPQSSTSQNTTSSAAGTTSSGQRMDTIKSMYGFGGFVYSLGGCPSADTMASDFSKMKSVGSRIVVTFDPCSDGSADSYDQVFTAAASAGLYVIPIAWTLVDSGSFTSESVPRMEAVTDAVIKNPSNVLAVAYGDEPLFDNDAGSPDTLASYITQMKSKFTSAGLDMPVSISDMAYGWQNAGDISSMVAAVDFFMINDFPYFAGDATSGGSQTSWNDFIKDLQYFASIANGKHLMVTQTGWATSKEEFAPNSASIDISQSSQEGYWKLLDSQCSSFFKPNSIAWMWRSWDDHITGWGVLDANGNEKFTVQASTSC